MAVISLRKTDEQKETGAAGVCGNLNWTDLAAGGALLAGALLLLAGKRRAGAITAASGTALALLEQKEMVRHYWDNLPGYIDNVQRVVGQVQVAVTEIEARRVQLHSVLNR